MTTLEQLLASAEGKLLAIRASAGRILAMNPSSTQAEEFEAEVDRLFIAIDSYFQATRVDVDLPHRASAVQETQQADVQRTLNQQLQNRGVFVGSFDDI